MRRRSLSSVLLRPLWSSAVVPSPVISLARWLFTAAALALGPTAHALVYLDSYSFPQNVPPAIRTTDSLTPQYKLRAKFNPGGIHAATTYNNNGVPLDSVPAPGTYSVDLYYVQYDSTGTTALSIGPTNTQTVTVLAPNNPPSCTVSASTTTINPGQTVTITVNGSDADGNLRYVNVDQVSPNNGYYGAVSSGTDYPPDGAFFDLGANYGSYTRNLPITLTTYGTFTFRGAVNDGYGWVYSPSNVNVTVAHEVNLSSTSASAGAMPTISTAEPLASMYKLRAKFMTPTGDFHAATSWNNNGMPLDVLPPPGTYSVALYWLKYDSTGTTLLQVGPSKVITVTVTGAGTTVTDTNNQNALNIHIPISQ
jgi:hypothetical protein